MLNILLDTPLITDWISSIAAAIGVPLALWSFVKLITRDEDKQKQLAALKEIAENQTNISSRLQDQVEQLTRQTGEFQYQSTLMFDSNQLLEKQVQVLNDFFLQKQSTEQVRLALERQKRLLEIKPHFIFNGGGSTPESFELRLQNKGGTAQQISIEQTNSEYANFSDINQCATIEKGQVLTIRGWANAGKTYWNGNTVNFEVNLSYTDVDHNQYFQRIVRQYHNYTIDNPILRQ